jgi:hypothetical protein
MLRLFQWLTIPTFALAFTLGCGDDKTTDSSDPGGPGARQSNGNGDDDDDDDVRPAPGPARPGPARPGLTPPGPGPTPRPGIPPADTETDDADETFTVEVPATAPNVRQGESETFDLSIDRGEDFDQAVTLSFRSLPAGITIEPAAPTIAGDEDTVAITVKAAASVELGEHTFEVVGTPQTGTPTPPQDVTVEVVEKE